MRKFILYFEPSAKGMFIRQKAKDGTVKVSLSTPFNFFSPGETIAQIAGSDSSEEIAKQVKPEYGFHKIVEMDHIDIGGGVTFDAKTKQYKSMGYGFAILKDDKLRLLSPLSFSKEKIKAYYNIAPGKLGAVPTFSDIEEVLAAEKIITPVTREDYDNQLERAFSSKKPFFRILVAMGREPIHGFDEYYEPLLSLEKKAGKMLDDGRIDFKEIDSIIQVEENQEIVKRIDSVKSHDGYDVFGNKVKAVKQPMKGFKKGENLVPSEMDSSIFVASLNGCISVEKNKISVLPIALIKGDVDLNTGNIDFNGTVHVTGSIKPGFKVRAAQDVIVDGDVEDAQVFAGGDISVALGVVGKESVKLVARGNLRAKFLLNAHVETGGSVEVDDSIINCNIVSYDRIRVLGDGGKIIGGKLLALYEIYAHTIGTPNETATAVTVGKNPVLEKELNDKRNEIKMVKNKVEDITTNLQLHFSNEVFLNPKEYLKILPPVKKKDCLLLLNDLANANSSLKKFFAEQKEIESRMKLLEEPAVKSSGTVYSGVVLSVKKSVKKLESPIENVRFFEDSEDKVIRFSSLS